MPDSVKILAPAWTKPQFDKIICAQTDVSFQLEAQFVDPKKILNRFEEAVEQDQAPDIVMLPAETLPSQEQLPIISLHKIAPLLEEAGAVTIENEKGIS